MSMYDLLKDAAKLAQKADNIELQQLLLDSQQSALDTQSQIAELHLRAERAESELERLRQKGPMMREHKWLVSVAAVGETHSVKYCMPCWDEAEVRSPLGGADGLYCVKCRVSYR